MQYATRVAIEHELFDDLVAHSQIADDSGSSSGQGFPATSVGNGQGVHVLFEIQVEKFHDEVELVSVCMDNIQEADDICMVELSQDGNLADGGAGDTLVFGLETNLFEGDDATAVAQVAGFVDDTIGT
ncbi:hypothetical protein FCULG_00005563 [Fusarium culmorum]|uniref:Uncharacterized protein n=1 Tax=Fusarium culmorum TaxID=5516 RepID=A0A2T4GVJ1_FUSCU|nr:hypothetical protein FCULG_00005563 [Fusarium culmorum]